MKQRVAPPSPLKAMQQNIHQHHWEEAVNRASGRESELVKKAVGETQVKSYDGL
jgi:hypothetical protein